MRKSGIILIFCMISILLISSIGRENIFAESKAKILPALEFGTGKVFSPEKGVKLSQARKMIIEYFQNEGT